MKISGLLGFAPHLFVSADALGEKYELSIAGKKGALFFPVLPDLSGCAHTETTPRNRSLVAPEPCGSLKQAEIINYWGMVDSFPSGNSSVHRAYLEFDVINIEGAQDIYKEFSAWEELLFKYIKIFTLQGTDNRLNTIYEPSPRLSLYEDSALISSIGDEGGISLEITMPEGDETLHRDQLIHSLEAASKGKNLKLEYLLLLNSLEARGKNDFRMAVIEAANAVETCLHSRIMKEWRARDIAFVDVLMKKFRMLGGKISLSREMGILPNGFNQSFGDLRNKVMHDGFFPDKKAASKMISEAMELLKYVEPEISE